YFSNSTSTCIFWHHDIDFQLDATIKGTTNQFVNIGLDTLSVDIEKDIYNYSAKEEKFYKNNLAFDLLIKKLTVAVEHTHCETFLVSQDHIPIFAKAFLKASVYSLWRSQQVRFLFIYFNGNNSEDFFNGQLFKDQANILIIEAENKNSSQFTLKTNKFVGSMWSKPEKLYEVAHIDVLSEPMENLPRLYIDKLQDLQGREVVVGAFDYRPMVVIDYNIWPQMNDRALDNKRGSVHINGAEVRVLLTLCELYNCTVEVDTSETEEWGFIYANSTGDGLLGLIIDGKTHTAFGGMYSWDTVYTYLDITTFLGRSGITCMVPAPKRIISWSLPLKPFQFSLWLGVLGYLFIETIALFATTTIEQTIVYNKQCWKSNFYFGLVTTLKLFISQSSQKFVTSTTVRALLFSMYAVDIIITSIYGSGLASILTLVTLDEAADSLQRLYKYQLPWTGSSDAWVTAIRAVKDDPIIMGVLANFHVYSIDEMRSKSKIENMGFVLERMEFGHFGNSEFLTTEALSRLKLMIDDIYFQFTVAYVPRLWPLLPKFNDLILTWHSTGFDKYWEWKITADYLDIKQQNQMKASMFYNFDIGPVKLGIDNFSGLILIWFVGMSLSILTFILELCLYKK
ncbi:uncharacterized protein LOC119666945, partial [Teleopsis dalmanni]|uniref:uncharacterized protein LOC119666945 n=1 Tax=Teleopsis dalmanni TaxID=139649 RepID=UPI0018CE3A8F